MYRASCLFAFLSSDTLNTNLAKDEAIMKVVLKNITKKFPSRNKKENSEVVAVDNFNFEIADGTLVGLLGPSGCGKSTTLNLISGLLEPTDGKIFF